MSLGTHIMMRLEDRRPIAPTLEARRELACVMLYRADVWGVFAFGCADNHLHIAIEGDDPGRFVAQVAPALRRRLHLPVAFERAHDKPIVDQRHRQFVVPYIFKQEEHHGISPDPLREATSLPDLFGMRALDPTMPRRVAALLPRLGRNELVELLGFDPARGEPHYPDLADAAAAAFGLGRLAGRDDASVRARRAAVHACPQLATDDLVRLLDVSRRTVQRFRREVAPLADTTAVQLQLRARGWLLADARSQSGAA